MSDPGSVVIENVTLKGNTVGVTHYGDGNLTLTNSTIAGHDYGLYFGSNSCLDHALIANNRFNNTCKLNIDSDADLSNIRWNMTKTKGTNIRGGSVLGGNLWLESGGVGFSETHADFNGDGICDEGYAITNPTGAIVGTDYLPLQNGGPSANFSVTPSSAMVGMPVSFNDTSVGTPTSWLWEFSDGKTETTRNVTHTYATTGTHQATLTVKNEFGTHTTTRTLDVAPYTIQGAVDAASAGDIVLVPAGAYDESVTVNKRLTLRGEAGVTVNGKISLTAGAAGARVENLTVNGVAGFSTITVNADDAVVRECTISGGQKGIDLYSAENCTVERCSVGGATDGISLYSMGRSRILDNQVTGCGCFGIVLIRDCPDCIISGNSVQNCDSSGIQLQSGCQGSVVESNTCSHNNNGITVTGCAGTTTVLRDNTIIEDRNIAVNLQSGDSVIVENVTAKDGNHGVCLIDVENITITNSAFTGFTRYGLYVPIGSSAPHSLIANNLFNNSENFYLSSSVDLSTIRWNTTKTFGKNIHGGPFLGGNYWLTPDGTGFSETHADLDGDGICDEGYAITNSEGDVVGTDSLPLHTCLPTANFTFAPAGGSTPLEVQFADASSGVAPRTYRWDFEDNTPPVDFVHPSHTFSTNGTHQVSLTVTNAFGSSTTTKTVTALDPPVAAISADLIEGNVPLTVQFTDASTGCVFERLWDFDDNGATSTDAALPHTFENAGTCNVTLNVSNTYASNKTTVKVVVHAAPQADFTFTPAEGNAPLTVTFNETSTGDVTCWKWDFGDGTPTESCRNVTHTFRDAGTFPVELNVSNAFGFHTKTAMVTVHEAPKADFDLDVSEGNAPLDVTFADASTGDVTCWKWDFDDLTNSTLQDPGVHRYTKNGTYTVRLNVSNAYGYNVTESVVTVHATPEADFTFTPAEGNAPLTVTFNETSTGDVDTWEWDFGDGTNATGRQHVHEYRNTGNYTVTLTASNAFGSDTSTASVRTFEAPAANFTVNPAGGYAPLTVSFTDTSTGDITDRRWDFGDGSTSTEEHPSHTYASAGTYTVSLRAGNPYAANTTVRENCITVEAPAVSGGGGGGHSSASAGAASNIPAGGHTSFGVRNSAIYEVGVTAGEKIPEVLVTVERKGLPAGADAPADTVYEYDEVTLYRTTDAALAGAAMNFTVTKTWLEARGCVPEDVVLYRYHDGAWQALPTRMVGEDESCYSFVAESPGFSLFAIGVNAPAPEPTVTPAGTLTAPPATTGAAAPPTGPQQSPLPVGLAVLGLCAGLLLLRRR